MGNTKGHGVVFYSGLRRSRLKGVKTFESLRCRLQNFCDYGCGRNCPANNPTRFIGSSFLTDICNWIFKHLWIFSFYEW